MNKKILIILVFLIIILLSIFIIYQIYQYKNEESFNQKENANFDIGNSNNLEDSVTMEAVIVKVNEKNLLVAKSNNPNSILFVSLGNETSSDFKANQEIRIYWDGLINSTWPEQINNVDKIEIIKEKSDITIPDTILRYCYNSKENLNIVVEGFSLSYLTIDVIDKNEIPYEYKEGYKLYKEVPNENYTGVGQKVGESTENSTAGYTGTGVPYLWQELSKISDVSDEEAINNFIINLDDGQKETFEFNFEKLYGNLESGKYYFCLEGDNNSIRIDFEINDNNIIYEEPQILW